MDLVSCKTVDSTCMSRIVRIVLRFALETRTPLRNLRILSILETNSRLILVPGRLTHRSRWNVVNIACWVL